MFITRFQALQENQNEVFDILTKDYSEEVIAKAFVNLYNSLEKRLSSDEVKQALREQNDKTILLSDAQKDAYTHITKGIKVNKETSQIHVFGLVVKKTILKPIEYKQTNSRELTIVQNKSKKFANLSKTNTVLSYSIRVALNYRVLKFNIKIKKTLGKVNISRKGLFICFKRRLYIKTIQYTKQR